MRAVHLTGLIGGLDHVEMVRISILQDDLLFTVRHDPDDRVGNDADNPDPPFSIKAKSVRKYSRPEFCNCFPLNQPVVIGDP